MKFLRISPILIVFLYLFSCSSQKKVPYYLENVNDTTGKGQVLIPELKIQPGDLLSIQVYSASTVAEVDALYNLPATTGGTSGFLVDAKGDIEYPRLGTIHVLGLAKHELAAEIKRRLTEPVVLLTNPSVIIRFLNFKVTMLGQVAREGVLTVNTERLTILEAVGLAGGITDYGKKQSVKVMREIDGKRETGYIDLSSTTIFESPYYNLRQNDVVIVEPTKQRAKQTDQALVAARISFALGIITSAAFIYNIFK
jgi:polysaccharide biosynthesis/export protein